MGTSLLELDSREGGGAPISSLFALERPVEKLKFRAITRGVAPTIAGCELTYLGREQIDYDKASQQHSRYCAMLRSWGVAVSPIPVAWQYPDSCFVQDTAVVLDELCVIANMGATTRRAETSDVARLITDFRNVRHILPPATLEGGDVVQIGKRLFVGLSRRTNALGIASLAGMVQPFGYTVTPVKVNGALHLTTACGVVNQETVLLNPRWLDASCFTNLRQLHVSEDEPWAANTIRINDSVCLEEGSPRTVDLVQPYVQTLETLDISELRKAEGSLSCLSLIFQDRPKDQFIQRTWGQ